MIDLKKLKEAYKPPFICDDEVATVDDSEGNAVIVVRGWSRLNPLFGHEEAFKFQLRIAHFIADRMNELINKETGRFYSDTEIEQIKAEFYQNGMNNAGGGWHHP